MVFYIRLYQRFMKLPILRDMVNWFGRPINWIIEHPDYRVMITQEPKRSDLKIGEKLIPGDEPIIEHRRRRHELIQAATESKAQQ